MMEKMACIKNWTTIESFTFKLFTLVEKDVFFLTKKMVFIIKEILNAKIWVVIRVIAVDSNNGLNLRWHWMEQLNKVKIFSLGILSYSSWYLFQNSWRFSFFFLFWAFVSWFPTQWLNWYNEFLPVFQKSSSTRNLFLTRDAWNCHAKEISQSSLFDRILDHRKLIFHCPSFHNSYKLSTNKFHPFCNVACIFFLLFFFSPTGLIQIHLY